MKRPPRVLWLAKGLGRGGAERLLTTGATHLDRSRFEVEVAYLLPWKDALVGELERTGLTVHCLGQRSSGDLRWVRRLRALVDERGFDVIHTHMPLPAVAARTALGRTRPALVHTEHNVWDRYRTPTYWANALTYRRNDAVIAVSNAVALSMIPRFLPRPPATTEVLIHGIEQKSVRSGPDARAHSRRVLGLEDDAFVVGSVANFTPKKDQDTLLRAFVRVKARCPTSRLVLIGTGPLEETLRTRTQELKLRDSVIFTGSREDVLELLPGLDVFALSSLHEGLSIALVEAMACGVPAVCTRVGGVPEAMRDGHDGVLVPPGDPDAFGEALILLAMDDGLRARCGANAHEHAAAFDIRHALHRIENLYDEVLSRR